MPCLIREVRISFVLLLAREFRKLLWIPSSGYPARPQMPTALDQHIDLPGETVHQRSDLPAVGLKNTPPTPFPIPLTKPPPPDFSMPSIGWVIKPVTPW